MNALNDHITELIQSGQIAPELPDFIPKNLRSDYTIRPYQQAALLRFIFYLNHPQLCRKPSQLLFHMATGSGKTLVMAGCILYLYHKGYRKFVFFVNSTNIIEKTKDNFLNPRSSKYLFNQNLSLIDKNVTIREVENFQNDGENDIQIVFTTIQGLHARLNTPKENQITAEDFENRKIVLISDEAHHINAETRRKKTLSKTELEELVSWESTVNKIFRSNDENILLEFTATADLTDPVIRDKYSDKLLFDYPLRQFRADGYSKEVKVLQNHLTGTERALQAIVISQYRYKIFEKYRDCIKPVILFKSRTIKESLVFNEQFTALIRNLKASDLEQLKNQNTHSAVQKAFAFFEKNEISIENLSAELKNDFSPEKCLVVNSKEESEEKQIALNTLEEETNPYRAIFAVDKLNEGWDVLNLFDIVRLYDTHEFRNSNLKKTTTSEAQLIGRGARYCPFAKDNAPSPFKRKFDADPDHEMRICEELYYHSPYNPAYIAELNTALEKIGLLSKSSETPEQIEKYHPTTQTEKKAPANIGRKIDNRLIFRKKFEYCFFEKGQSEERIPILGESRYGKAKGKMLELISVGLPIVRKAINKLEFYQFTNLKKHWPALRSVSEFITSTDYLGQVKVEIKYIPPQRTLLPQERVEVVMGVLQEIANEIERL